MVKLLIVAASVAMAGCAAIPVQETTLINGKGGSVTCKQVGRGVASYWVGKSVYEDCITKAHSDGYN
jgi:hypothetical protein